VQAKRGFGCGFALVMWPVALLVVWIVAQAISAITVGHDISEAGCNWVIGISLAIAILLGYWSTVKPARERDDVQMRWLGDIARRRAEEKRKQDNTYAIRLRDGRKEGENAHKMVMAALKEVGRAYWGSVDKSWNVAVTSRGLPSVCWEVHGDTDYYWSVWLTGSGSDGWRFGVRGNGEPLYTADTSEAELKRVLRLAVKNGPAFKSGQ
jgi:hypothetical protein